MRENKTLSLQDVMVQARQKKALLPVTIRLDNEDIATARQLADDKGVGYQTYIKLLLHEALQRRLIARPASLEDELSGEGMPDLSYANGLRFNA